MAQSRHQSSGAANRSRARQRVQVLAAAGRLELKFPIRVADCEPLVLIGDLSEDDLTTGGRLSAALTELLPDMVRHYASRLEERPPRALSLYAVALPDSRTALAKRRWPISNSPGITCGIGPSSSPAGMAGFG